MKQCIFPLIVFLFCICLGYTVTSAQSSIPFQSNAAKQFINQSATRSITPSTIPHSPSKGPRPPSKYKPNHPRFGPYKKIQPKAFTTKVPYGNEWINYTQHYYKIPVAIDGIFRIRFTSLDSLGIPITAGNVNPNTLQLFNQGKQQYLYVQPGSNGYIEFYGKHNDGGLDSTLYTGIKSIPNPYYSLFSDTAYYFLTWAAGPNLRMQAVSDTNLADYVGTPLPYFLATKVNAASNNYYIGATYVAGESVTDPQYTATEGYFMPGPNLGNTVNFSLGTSSVYTGPGAPPVVSSFLMLGESQEGCGNCVDHNITVTYPGATTPWDTSFYGYASIKKIFTCSPAQINSTAVANFSFTSNSANIPPDSPGSIAIAYVRMQYPHSFDLEGLSTFTMDIPSEGQSKSLINITNYRTNGINDTVRIYDLTNNYRIKVFAQPSIFSALLPNPNNAKGIKHCFIVPESKIMQVFSQAIHPAGALRNGFFTNYPAMVANTDSAYLMITHSSLMGQVAGNNVNTFQGYRQSSQGGGYHVVVADADELYDEFFYGINKDPLAIRGFAHYALDYAHTPPKFLFLIGKSIQPIAIRKGGPSFSNCLVPTIGNPPCDLMFTSWLNTNLTAPTLATARLSAKTPADVTAYLNKVKEYESSHEDSTGWMKRVLHFAGGVNGTQNASFLDQMNQWAAIINQPSFGANVSTFTKSSAAPISINTSDSLQMLINTGVSLMSFLGHSSSQFWDVGVDKPTSFSNKGKYPMIISNGCYGGGIHDDYTNIALGTNSEYWTLIPELGGIGFIGSSSPGMINILEDFTTPLYADMDSAMYGMPFSQMIQQVIQANESKFYDMSYKAGYLSMTQEGDPGISLNAPASPDYIMFNHNIAFDTKSSPTNFKVTVTAVNLGKAIAQNFSIQLSRILPNGRTQQYLKYVNAPFNQDTFVFVIPYNPTFDAGINQFRVTLNYYREITESNYANNTAEAALDIPGNSILPIYPYNYAIVPGPTVKVKATTLNPLNTKVSKYTFQIDTNDSYSSNGGKPIDQITLTSRGGVVEWTPKLLNTIKDSIVYFWRVTSDSIWHESSFQVIKGKQGWGQASFYQFKNNNYQYLHWDRPQRQFQFVNTEIDIHLQTGLYDKIGVPLFPYPQINMNGSNQVAWSCNNATYVFVAFNPVTGSPFLNTLHTGSFGLYHSGQCGHTYEPSFEYHEDPVNIKAYIDALPNGYYVACYTMLSHHDSVKVGSGPSIFSIFKSLGSAQLKPVNPNLPYLFFGRKGAIPNSAVEEIGATPTSLIAKDIAITTKWTNGTIYSPVIGPAQTWDSLFWDFKEYWKGTDSIQLGMIGIKADGTVDTLVGSVSNNIPGFSRKTNKISLKNFINPSLYPYLQLMVNERDSANPLPPQMKRWQVLFSPVPDLALNPNAPLAMDTLKSASLQEGDTLRFIYPVQNTSDFSFPINTTLYSAWIIDANGNTHALPDRIKNKAISPGQVANDTIKFSTKGYPNANQLWVEVNPVGRSASQMEQVHYNNVASVNFNVKQDKVNPLLDVTFDGQHILNQDIISPQPNILMQLSDENKFLALNDPANFKVFIISPGSTTPVPIAFGAQMTFIPAVLPKNSCKIIYTPTFTKDGTYQLIVQATDRSGNTSGSLNYQISFQVITESMISQVMNYPNPFTTATHFVFTLTGSTVPDNILIRIMTITGKVVKEISKDELGPIHIGRNVTDYAWDGKDQFGNPLGIGVYFYHVETRLNGHSMQNYATGADQFFTNGFGKMYLMR